MNIRAFVTAAVIVPFLVVASVANAAGGIGVGNGGNSAREAYVARLKKQMGGQPMNDRKASVADLSAWCHRASALLDRELARGRLQVREMNYEFAWQILQDALYAVARSIQVDPEFGGPLTKVLVDRGLLISRALDERMPGGSRQALVSKLSYLFDYVQFVIEMEHEVDEDWYVPYRYHYRRCGNNCGGNFEFREFERRFLDYARRQLEFVTYTLTEQVDQNGEMDVRPIGDPKVFLKAAELTTGWVARDVAGNLYAYTKACTVTQLATLSQDLRDYNTYRDRTRFINDREAVYLSYQGMTHAANQLIEDPHACRSWE